MVFLSRKLRSAWPVCGRLAYWCSTQDGRLMMVFRAVAYLVGTQCQCRERGFSGKSENFKIAIFMRREFSDGVLLVAVCQLEEMLPRCAKSAGIKAASKIKNAKFMRNCSRDREFDLAIVNEMPCLPATL